MNSQDYWKVFLDSGIPEYYLLFSRAKKQEESYVLDDSGTGSEGLAI